MNNSELKAIISEACQDAFVHFDHARKKSFQINQDNGMYFAESMDEAIADNLPLLLEKALTNVFEKVL